MVQDSTSPAKSDPAMRDNINWQIDNSGEKDSTSAANSKAASQQRGSKLDLLKSAWNSIRNGGPRDTIMGSHGHRLVAFLRRRLAVIVLVALLVFPVGAIILGYLTRPAPGTARQVEAGAGGSSTDSGSGEKKSKPSAGKPMMPTSQAPPPVVMHQPPAALEPQSPTGMAAMPARPLSPAPAVPTPAPNAPLPGTPGVAGKPPYTPVVYTARHDKVFGEGCSGQLTLDGTGLAFQCSEDPRSSVRVALDDIESVDGNGVRLISGKRYHFSIAGMGKSNAEQLFSNWLHQVR